MTIMDLRVKKIKKEMEEREFLQEGYRDRMLDTTTDVERTHYAGDVNEEVTYEEDYQIIEN